MRLTTKVLGIVWVPLLSACMMVGGAGHTDGWDGPEDAGDAASGHAPAPLRRAEASSGGLTIALSIPAPAGGAALAIEAWLRPDSAGIDLDGADVRLRIETPGGRVDGLHMQRVDWPGPARHYQALYSFPTTGVYLVTAEGRTGTGPEIRMVSVTARADVSGHANGGRHDWVAPVAILGGLGMVAMMALMMSGSMY